MATTEVSKGITWQEFLNMEIQQDDQLMYELLNGEVVKYSAPESTHQVISANLFRQLDHCVFSKKTGKVLYAPISVFQEEGKIKSKVLKGFQVDIQHIFAE